MLYDSFCTTFYSNGIVFGIWSTIAYDVCVLWVQINEIQKQDLKPCDNLRGTSGMKGEMLFMQLHACFDLSRPFYSCVRISYLPFLLFPLLLLILWLSFIFFFWRLHFWFGYILTRQNKRKERLTVGWRIWFIPLKIFELQFWEAIAGEPLWKYYLVLKWPFVHWRLAILGEPCTYIYSYKSITLSINVGTSLKEMELYCIRRTLYWLIS